MQFSKRLYAAIYVSALVSAVGPIEAATRQTLRNHMPQAVGESRRIGSLSPAERINLAVGLPVRNREDLDTLLQQVSDPRSPLYRQYLSNSEFTERFGPSQADYDKLTAFFEANGFTISGTHSNRTILDISGPVSAVNRTLHINMTIWQHPQRGQFFAPDADPSLDVDVPVLAISGLDNFVLPKPMNLKITPLDSATPYVTGSGPSGYFIGNDFRDAYAPGVTLTGAGQAVGLFELGGFYAADVAANFQQAGLPAVPVQTVLLDGVSGAPNAKSNGEVTLDIMMTAYMAPGANIIVYEGTSPNDVLNRMATDNTAKQLSCSWGFSPIDATTEQIFQQLIAQGQSFLVSSGDTGAYNGAVFPPADDPNVTVVGGTALTTTGPGGTWLSETAWSGSGGGVSTTYPIPSYQQGMNLAASGGSNTMRNVPDVAMLGQPESFLIINNGQEVVIGGTSQSAPLWAGFLALTNQQAAAKGAAAVGFLNPAIYAIGNGAKYASDLHDITTGSNGFTAVAGFDLVTGWGSPAGQTLIDALTAVPATPSFTLSATPSVVSVQAGATATSTIQVAATGGFSGSVSLSVSGLPTGVTAAFSPATTTTTSTLTFIAAANAASGTTIVTVTGTSGALTKTVTLSLTVNGAQSFSLTLTPPALTIAQGASGTTTVGLTSGNGFSGTVNVAVSGLPTGVTAAFSGGGTAALKLTLTASATATVGTAAVTVTGTSGTLTAKANLALTVTSATTPSFTLAASVSNVSVMVGGTGTSTISIVPQAGFTGPVSLSATGLPTGVTATFNPATATTTSTLTLTVAATAAPGATQFMVKGVSGAITASLPMTVTVTPAVTTTGDFSIALTPPSLSVVQGGKGSSVIALTATNGFHGTVNVSLAGLPAGVTSNFSELDAAGKLLVTFTASATATSGASKVTVTAVSGALTHSAILTLMVVAPGAGTVPVNLSASYNVLASAVDNVPFASVGLDRVGDAYSGVLLGASQSVNGTVFALGPMGVADAVSERTVALPSGQFTGLKMLATGVQGNQADQSFTVTYTDGTKSTFKQSLSDWFSFQNNAGETIAVATGYRDVFLGTTDPRIFNLYSYSFSLNGAKTVRFLTLPVNRNVIVLAVTLTGGIPVAVPTDLSKSFNAVGITSDGKPFNSGLDGDGYAYSKALLGGSVTVGKTQFLLEPADQPNVVSGTGNPIALPAGKYSSLLILGTAVNGAQTLQPFTVTYSDGTAANFTQNLSDWFAPGEFPGESVALATRYRNVGDGSADGRNFYLYEYSFDLDNTKTVASVTLPANANVKVLAMDLKP